jgi:hypothetical protein
MSPLEKNSRKLIGVVIGSFPDGGTSEDLRRAFEASTGLRRQQFYYALREAKRLGWLIGSGEGQGQLYVIDHEAFSKAPASTGDAELGPLVDTQAERLEESQSEPDTLRVSGSNGGAAISALVAIVGDDSLTVRQRLKASATVLGYRVQDPGVTEFVRRFLERLCASGNISPDYRIWASELLRRFEGDPKILPQILRPDPSPVCDVDPVKEEEERRIEHERKVAHIERQAKLDAEQLVQERQRLWLRVPIRDVPASDK